MSSLVIFDTSIFIDQFRTGRHQAKLSMLTGLIRTSAVVLSELWRGATTPAERRTLRALEKNHPILLPTVKHWVISGSTLAKVRSEKGLTGDKLRNLHFDLLIALTARSCGARLITSNRADFELIDSYVPIRLEVWP